MSLSTTALVAAANTGSPALTIWPNDTAPAPRAMTARGRGAGRGGRTGNGGEGGAFGYVEVREWIKDGLGRDQSIDPRRQDARTEETDGRRREGRREKWGGERPRTGKGVGEGGEEADGRELLPVLLAQLGLLAQACEPHGHDEEHADEELQGRQSPVGVGGAQGVLAQRVAGLLVVDVVWGGTGCVWGGGDGQAVSGVFRSGGAKKAGTYSKCCRGTTRPGTPRSWCSRSRQCR